MFTYSSPSGKRHKYNCLSYHSNTRRKILDRKVNTSRQGILYLKSQDISWVYFHLTSRSITSLNTGSFKGDKFYLIMPFKKSYMKASVLYFIKYYKVITISEVLHLLSVLTTHHSVRCPHRNRLVFFPSVLKACHCTFLQLFFQRDLIKVFFRVVKMHRVNAPQAVNFMRPMLLAAILSM